MANGNIEVTDRLIQICKQSIESSILGISKLPLAILDMEGMSSKKNRILLNTIGDEVQSYVEVGMWKGSTFLSTLYDNKQLRAYAIDNWSEFGGPRDAFLANLFYHRNHLTDSIVVYEDDFINAAQTMYDEGRGPIECYFYDGNHSEQSQIDSIKYMLPNLAKTFIYIVDDFSWPMVKAGALEGIKRAGLNEIWSHTLISEKTNDADGYWNGLYIGVLEQA